MRSTQLAPRNTTQPQAGRGSFRSRAAGFCGIPWDSRAAVARAACTCRLFPPFSLHRSVRPRYPRMRQHYSLPSQPTPSYLITCFQPAENSNSSPALNKQPHFP